MPNTSPNVIANGNIRPSRFVKMDTTNNAATSGLCVLEADANEAVIGVAQEGGRETPLPGVTTVYAGIAGDPLKIYGDGDDCLVCLAGTVNAGDRVESDADGCAVAALSNANSVRNVGGIMMEPGVSGEYRRMQVKIFTLTNP